MLQEVFKSFILNQRDKEALWESFKVRQALEDNPDSLDERLVSLHALLNARKQSKLTRIQKLLNEEADEEQAKDDIKNKGLEHVGETYLLSLAIAKTPNWAGIWKSIKKIDKDSNGYVTVEELDEIFREWFPLELEGKTVTRFFRTRYGSVANRNLINYKQLKADFNAKLLAALGELNEIKDSQSSLTERKKPISYVPKKVMELNESALRIEGNKVTDTESHHHRKLVPLKTETDTVSQRSITPELFVMPKKEEGKLP